MESLFVINCKVFIFFMCTEICILHEHHYFFLFIKLEYKYIHVFHFKNAKMSDDHYLSYCLLKIVTLLCLTCVVTQTISRSNHMRKRDKTRFLKQ